MANKVGGLYSIIRGFIERGLCGDNAREVSFKTLDAFESAVREDERKQISKTGELYNMGASIMVPASVLAPKENV